MFSYQMVLFRCALFFVVVRFYLGFLLLLFLTEGILVTFLLM